MEIKLDINKETLIYVGIIVILCIISFLIGKCSQSSSDIGKGLIEGIDKSNEIANEIYEDLINAGCSIEAAEQQAKFVSDLLFTMQSSTEVLEKQIADIKSQNESNIIIINNLLEIYDNYSDYTDNVFDIMIEKAEKYEEIIEGLKNEKLN